MQITDLIETRDKVLKVILDEIKKDYVVGKLLNSYAIVYIENQKIYNNTIKALETSTK